MIGMDTNVFLRFLVVDDNEKQRDLARQFMRDRTIDDPAFISLVTLAETVWVLRYRLRYSQDAIIGGLSALFTSVDIVFEAHQELVQLLSKEKSPGTGLADYLVVWAGKRSGCAETVTFDKTAAKHIDGMRLLT